jgi:hypothetical protein
MKPAGNTQGRSGERTPDGPAAPRPTVALEAGQQRAEGPEELHFVRQPLRARAIVGDIDVDNSDLQDAPR